MQPEPEFITRVERALDRAVRPRSLAWYRASAGTVRWIIHPPDSDFAHVDSQWNDRDPNPEGHHYSLDHLAPQRCLLLTHSNHLVGPKDWATLGLRTATVIHLDCVDLAERMEQPGGDLASAIGRLLDAHPPNLFSRT